jgi:hypothetical protein
MRFIKLDENNIVTSTRVGVEIIEGEIQSDLGECGQIMQTDGTFVWPDSPAPIPTLEDKVNYLYYKGMGVIA